MSERSIILRDGEIRELLERGEVRVLRPIKSELRSHSDGRKRRVFMRRDILEVNELLSRRQEHPLRRISCPAGTVGSRLWVREAWRFDGWTDEGEPWIRYAADGRRRLREHVPPEWADRITEIWASLSASANIGEPARDSKWRPSIHMPRWASRMSVTLSAVSVDPAGAGLAWAYQLKRVD